MPINKKTSGWHPWAPRKASKAKRKRRKEKRTAESLCVAQGRLGVVKSGAKLGHIFGGTWQQKPTNLAIEQAKTLGIPRFSDCDRLPDSPLTFSSLGKNASGWRRKSTRSGRLRQLARTWASRDGQSFSRTCWLLHVGEWWSIVWNWGQTHLDRSNFFLPYLRSIMGKAMTDCGGQLMISSKNHEGTVPLSSN
jgi:hypothetical protein